MNACIVRQCGRSVLGVYAAAPIGRYLALFIHPANNPHYPIPNRR